MARRRVSAAKKACRFLAVAVALFILYQLGVVYIRAVAPTNLRVASAGYTLGIIHDETLVVSLENYIIRKIVFGCMEAERPFKNAQQKKTCEGLRTL
jgi:hypothetical protein